MRSGDSDEGAHSDSLVGPADAEAVLPADRSLSALQADTASAPRNAIRAAMLKVVYLMEPDMEGDRFRAMVQYLADQDYTAAELAFAADRLTRDEELDEKLRYGGRITPADFERIIAGHRRLRSRIKKPMYRGQAEEAIELEPDLTWEDFDRQDRPHDDRDSFVVTDEALGRIFDMARTRKGQ